MAAEWGLSFPVCYDESQEAAKSYLAACRPDLYRLAAARSVYEKPPKALNGDHG